jgi:polysaccharide pyruvyl transferase CsaB
VLSADPNGTSRTYGVEATPRADVRAVRAAILRTDCVLSGGGGLFQNSTSTRSLLYYTGIVRSAIRSGKKTMIFAQSIGPLDFIGRAIVRVACRGVGAATVRDERSRTLLQQAIPHLAVERTADPVFLYDPPPAGDLAVEGLGDASKPLVVACIRMSANFSAVSRTVASTVDLLAERFGARTAFLPLGGARDADAATRVIRMAKSSPVLLPEHDLAGAAAIISRARAVIGMRLHALILAARLGIPFLAIPYDPKVSALCEDLGYPLPPLVDPAAEAPSRERIEASVGRVWSSRDELATMLLDAAARMRARAERNFDVLDALLQGAPSPAPNP